LFPLDIAVMLARRIARGETTGFVAAVIGYLARRSGAPMRYLLARDDQITANAQNEQGSPRTVRSPEPAGIMVAPPGRTAAEPEAAMPWSGSPVSENGRNGRIRPVICTSFTH